MMCPEPRCGGKVLHGSHREASAHLRFLNKRKRPWTESGPLHVYRCPAGHGYHVGHRPRHETSLRRAIRQDRSPA